MSAVQCHRCKGWGDYDPCLQCANTRKPSNLRYEPPTRLAVDRWRQALEAVACGPIETVWDGLKPVITEMRLVLGYELRPPRFR